MATIALRSGHCGSDPENGRSRRRRDPATMRRRGDDDSATGPSKGATNVDRARRTDLQISSRARSV